MAGKRLATYTFTGTQTELADPQRLELALRQWNRWLAERLLRQEHADAHHRADRPTHTKS